MSVGTSIFVDRSLAPLISANGILLEGRAQFITLQILGTRTLTIINVYASCSSNERASMWKRLSEANLIADHFILGGDFNHWEEIQRGGVAGKRQMHRREAAAWHHLTLQYGLMDAWLLDSFWKMSAKEFTFDNGRSGAHPAVSRIDKFLISQDLDSRGGRIEGAASIRKFSDHSPLVLSIWGQPDIPDKLSHYFDSSLLKDEKGRAEMLQAWEGELPKPLNDSEWAPWLEAATRRVLACNTRLVKERRRLRRAQVRVHVKKIQLAEEQLQRDPTNKQVRDILSESQGKLAEVFQALVGRNSHLSTTKWFMYGDTCSKNFFDFHRIEKKKTLLKELEVDGGTISDQKDLSHYITRFYANLYESETHAPGTSEAQERCWENVPTRVTEAMNANMTRSLSLAEITKAITLLPKGKALRHDGIPIEFFREYVNEVAPTLLLAFKAMLA
jgi:hypothetical protein